MSEAVEQAVHESNDEALRARWRRGRQRGGRSRRRRSQRHRSIVLLLLAGQPRPAPTDQSGGSTVSSWTGPGARWPHVEFRSYRVVANVLVCFDEAKQVGQCGGDRLSGETASVPGRVCVAGLGVDRKDV